MQRTTPTTTAANGRVGGGLGPLVGSAAGAVKKPSNSADSRTTGIPQSQADVPTTAEQTVAEQNASFEYGTTEGSEQTKMLAAQDAGLFDEPTQPATPQPAAPPEPPTSSGDIDVFAGLAGDNNAAGVNTSPQLIAQDDS